MSRLPLTITFVLAGTVPFVLLSVAAALQLFPDVHHILQLLLTYATAMISFLGGIHLGVGLAQPDMEKKLRRILWIESIWPSVIAWGLLYSVDLETQLLALTVLYSIMWAIDSILYSHNLMPQWFFNLRCVLTPIMVVSLYVAYFGLI